MNQNSIINQKVAFHTLGCKLNFSETSAIGRQFQEAGYEAVPFDTVSDIYVINTCSVTDHADRKTKRVVKEALKLNPYAQIVVIGCYAQLKPDEIIRIPGVNLVLGAKEKFNIVEHVSKLSLGCEPAIFNSHIKESLDFHPAFSVGDRTRSFLKVQDGCDYFCAFCTIPLARGRSRSSYIKDVLQSVEKIASEGVREVVLTGVNIGDFSNEDNETFFDLIQTLDKLDAIDRFRISSIEPNLLTDEIIQFVSTSKKFVPHFHIPLQSGSDDILEKMRRRYKTALYTEKIAKIKELMPHCCIGVDVICGFPGETEAEFLKTYNFLNQLPVSYLHVFTYSERPNTTALRMKGRVLNADRSERNKRLTILSEKKRRAFYDENSGKEFTVLWEQAQHAEYMYGFTENYIKVKKLYDADSVNKLEKIRLGKQDSEGIMSLMEENVEILA